MGYTVLHYPLSFCYVLYDPTLSLLPPAHIYCLPPLTPYPFHLTRLPQDRKIKSLLIPTPLPYLWYQPILLLQSNVGYRLCWNVLRKLIMAHGYVGLHLLLIYFLYSLFRQGVFPGTFLPAPCLFLWDLPLRPKVEYPQQPPKAHGHDPILCA